MSRNTDAAAALRTEWMQALASAGHTSPQAIAVMDAMLDYLHTHYPSQRIYIPARARIHDIPRIRAAIESGDSIRAICSRHGIDRRTLYRLLDE